MPKTYIALDLETTGFDAINDQVIEIAAIKFKGEEIVGKWTSLINPEVPIPPMITHITGLKAEDLINAPRFAEIKDSLVDFLGDYPIIGHNIPFDIGFLNSKGLRITNPLYDTLQLAPIFMPGLASYSLDTLTRVLKIKHEEKHRAYSDTQANYELFLKIQKKITGLDSGLFTEIKKVLEKSTWSLAELFTRAVAERRLKPAPSGHTNKLSRSDTLPEESFQENPGATSTEHNPNIQISPDQLADFYKENGALSKVIKDYEKRDTQNLLTRKILDCFENGSHLLAEAGTGTGKTMAYLLASIYHSLKTGQKVIISTYTHNLQSQIINKDVPILSEALEKISTDLGFKSVILKGRKNYLSLKRLEKFLRKDFFMDHEVTVLIKVLMWLKTTPTGDLSELPLQGKEFTVLEDLYCTEYACPHNDPEYKNNCYLLKARQKAENANLVIVNHALLIQNLVSENTLLPSFDYLIIDEAHHLEKVTTETLTITLSLNQSIKPFEKIVTILEEIERHSDKSFQELKIKIRQLVVRIEIFFGLLGIFIEKNLDPSRFQYQLNLRPQDFNTLEWHKVKESAKILIELGKEIIANLKQTEDQISEEQSKDFKNQLFDADRKINEFINGVPQSSNNNQINWILKNLEGSIIFKSAPLNIGDTLNQFLFSKKSIILTSATLRTNNTFSFLRDQLRLDEKFEELTLASHFSYPDQVKILIPEGFPEPATEGYFLSSAELIESIIRKNGGRTLVLFTSKKALAATYHLIAPRLKTEGLIILAQHITGGRGKIIEHFKDEPGNCAIFGTDSFWEGVDIKGSDLTCVIMQKLPFDPPDDPIIVARSHKYENSFGEFQLPRAILKFKQGFGRLIRSSKDVGSIVILDSRITQKSYGHQFLESLPAGIQIKHAPKERLAEYL